LILPVDLLGSGLRNQMIAVAQFSQGGNTSHVRAASDEQIGPIPGLWLDWSAIAREVID
jgi:hypothetical protein